MKEKKKNWLQRNIFFFQNLPSQAKRIRMSLSKCNSTKETLNYARVAVIILGPCTDVLRNVLMKEITPPDLIKQINNYIAEKKKPQINQLTQKLIYGHRGNYSEFDIPLLYFLFRNISSIPPHAKQWGNNPSQFDRSVSANIERIRLIRNDYVHVNHPSISKSDFEQEWKNIFQIVKDLEQFLGSSTDLQDKVKVMRSCFISSPVEPVRGKHFF